MLWSTVGVLLGYAAAFYLLMTYGGLDLRHPEWRFMAIMMLCAGPFLLRWMWVNRTPDNKQVIVHLPERKMILASWIALLVMFAIPSLQVPASFAFVGLLFFTWIKERAARRRAGK
jgi:hypothetical protein